MALIKYEDLGIKLKPGHKKPPLEIQEKLIQSFIEAAEMTERKLACPICNTKLEGIYSDGTGHVNVKCQKCGFASPMNLAYFKRRKKRNTFPFYPGGGNYKGKR